MPTPKRHGRAQALVAESRVVGGPKVVTAFPTSWMNRSGGPVAQLMDFYGVDAAHVIVLHDELDLPLGTVRLKQGGGHGGHNGMRDIIAARGGDVLRVRLGVGRPPGRQDPADFVLKPFAKAEQEEAELLVAARRRRGRAHRRGGVRRGPAAHPRADMTPRRTSLSARR